MTTADLIIRDLCETDRPSTFCPTIEVSVDEATEIVKRHVEAPMDMVLHCPECHAQHIDAPKDCTLHDCHLYGVCYAQAHQEPDRCDRWDNPVHRSHLCHACGCIWRPCDTPTNGVEAIQTRGKDDTWPKVCEHVWTDARNAAVLSGEMCLKCGAIKSGYTREMHEGLGFGSKVK